MTPATARRSLTMLLTGLLFVACTRESDAPEVTATFGIFYGGQVQQRQELPFELHRARQRQGFRLDFDPPLEHETEIEWELSRPARRSSPAATPSHPEGRVTELGSVTLAPGRARFEQPLHFKPGDPLGLWNLRVVMGEQVLIDRAFLVYDRAARRRENKAAHVADAGL